MAVKAADRPAKEDTVTVMDLKREVATLEPPDQDELTAFLFQLKLRRDPEHGREMARRRDDRRPESWVRLEDFEAEIRGDGSPE